MITELIQRKFKQALKKIVVFIFLILYFWLLKSLYRSILDYWLISLMLKWISQLSSHNMISHCELHSIFVFLIKSMVQSMSSKKIHWWVSNHLCTFWNFMWLFVWIPLYEYFTNYQIYYCINRESYDSEISEIYAHISARL